MATAAVHQKIEGFFTRLDQHLEGLSHEARDTLLARLEREWIADLGEFVFIVDTGRPIPQKWEGADAADFHHTIAEISKRRAQVLA